MPKIYLDHQAATPLRPEVREAMLPWLDGQFGNAGSLHAHGLRARNAVREARRRITAFINASSPGDIVFTSDGTEAMNLAVKGVAWANRSRGNHLVLSAIEHPAIEHSVAWLEQQGFRGTRVPVNGEGVIEPGAIAAACTEETILIATHLVNHDLGTIQPVAELGQLAAGRAIPLFVDAEAAAGLLPVDVGTLGASLLSFSPHRFGGPPGVGVLYRNSRVPMTPLLHGGNQEGGLRAGLENVAAIVGAGVAADLAAREMQSEAGRLRQLQVRLWRGIQERLPGTRLNGPAPGAGRAPNSLNLSFPGTEGEGVALACDLKGLAIGSGSACLGRALKIPPALAAIGLDAELARANILLSLGHETTEAEVDAAAEIMAKIVARLRTL